MAFDGKTFTIPAQYVSEVSHIKLFINGRAYGSWSPSKVDRNKSNSVEDFTVMFTSPETGSIDYPDGTTITFQVYAYEGAPAPLVFRFQVIKTVVLSVSVATEFTRV